MNQDVTCRVCLKPFSVHEGRLERGGGKYCSTACYAAGRKQDTEARFWAKVERGAEDDCWLWTGGISMGYGQVYVNAYPWRVYDYAWFLAHGTRPESGRVRHYCGTRTCVNPMHLFLLQRRS